MKRPLVLAVLFHIVGILLGRYCVTLSFAPFAFALFCALCTAILLYRKSGIYQWFLILPLFVLGIYNAGFDQGSLFASLDGQSLRVEGIVTDRRQTEYGTQYLTLSNPKITSGQSVFTPNRKISVTVPKPVPLLCGQAVIAEGIGEAFDFQRNPGAWSEAQYQTVRGFAGKMTATAVTPGAVKYPAYEYAHRFTQAASDAFDRALTPDTAPLIKAMVLGDKSSISEDTYNAFKRTGVSHLLAISGLHLSIISMLVFFLLGQLGLGLRGRSAGTIVLAVIYCFLTGASVSTVRAVLMVSVGLFGNLILRSSDFYTSVAFAALILLLKNPLYLWDAGFQLSFSAVLGIVACTRPLEQLAAAYLRLPAKALTALSASLAATLATLPISAYFFGGFSLVGVLANLLLLPLSALLVGSGLLFALLQGLAISSIVAPLLFAILRYYLAAAELLQRLPFAYILTGQPPLVPIIIYYILLCLILLYDRGTISRPRFRLLAAALAALMALCPLPAHIQAHHRVDVTFLDVGQGDCSILRLPGDVHIMIDGGGKAMVDIGENTGQRVIYPYLNQQGISSLDAIFLSHSDMDHAAGVIELLSLVPVGRLFLADCAPEDEIEQQVLAAAAENGVPVSRIHSGYRATFGEASLECVYPHADAHPESANNASLVLRLSYAGQSMLFTGDMERVDEKILADAHEEIQSTVLKVPHHGSATSSSAIFLDAVAPTWAVAGSGADNTFGHPAPEVTERYAQRGIPYYNTAETGAVFIKLSESGVLLETMKDRVNSFAKTTTSDKK